MCGIAGILEFDLNARIDESLLFKMASLISYRGPDEEGVYVWGAVGLAHRRLSIIDLYAGHQPMLNEDRSVGLVFNGEIYNYLDLKQELSQKGHFFKTTSDTEVLLKVYEEYGSSGLSRLNGMFAFALWDNHHKQFLMARDRLGKKPLFYYQDSHRLIFASEMKSILVHSQVKREIDQPALDAFLSHGYIPAPETIFRGIKKLPPAHLLTVQKGRVELRPYWDLHFNEGLPVPSEGKCLEQIDILFQDAVRSRLMSDVPLGAFLSGGIDSSAVVGMMAILTGRPVKTFTIGFEEQAYSEIEDARIVARHFGTEHHEMIVKPSAVDLLPDLVWHFDEPFGDSSAIPTYYVCKVASERVKVILSGDGGDELFAGYARYLVAADRERYGLIPGWIRRQIFRPLVRRIPLDWTGRNTLYGMAYYREGRGGYDLGIYPYIKEALYTPEFSEQSCTHERPTVSDQVWEASTSLSLLSRLQRADTKSYLPNDILVKVDRMSMAHSLEVRSPLLDYRLMEYLATLPPEIKIRNGMTKHLFKKYVSRFLPPSVMVKKKHGFGVPLDRWFRGDLQGFSKEILLDPKTLSRGYFRQCVLERILQDHVKGKHDYSVWIWLLLVLELWHRIFMDPTTRKV